jgi:small subunit ribosomal protein S1
MCADMLPYDMSQSSETMNGAATVARATEDPYKENAEQTFSTESFDGQSLVFENVAPEPDWSLAEKVYDQDKAIQVRITGFNKGGLLTNWSGLPGFLPASQLEDFPECHLLSKRLEVLSSWVERDVLVKIIELDRRMNRFILSERAASVTADARERLLNRVKVGDKLSGRVTNLAAFGVFVDLGGVEGLIHISELSWGRVVEPGDFVTPGQEIQVVVLNIDREVKRVAIRRKKLLPTPWQAIEERYEPGQVVEGMITNIAKFGAFAEVEEGLEGLIHISEITDLPFSTPFEVLEVGEHVLARVLEVDGSNHRLALSLKRG